jgi:hypothetical protein
MKGDQAVAIVGGNAPASPAGGLPPGVPNAKPAAKDFESPVGWLLGRQLIANLKWILLYTAFKGKLDPRDWMNAEVIPPYEPLAEIDKFWRQWNPDWRAEEDGVLDSTKEFWFDYISDTGDGQRAVYSIAYLCMSDLATKKSPRLGDKLEFVSEPDRAQLDAEDKLLLPRGTFLFVGGDTSYHISDYSTLAVRFQNPFCWAYADLYDRARSVMGKLPRMLVGIPGNHDYYDSLDGFNRQFRRPSTADKKVAGGRPPLLAIPTFRRSQEASYLAMRLPFGWWFWGMDTEEGEIDFRQLEFFKDLQYTYQPKRLIVATPEPTTVFGKYAKEDENQSKTFAALELERPFLKNPESMGAGKCRLDLAGDVHHYARHWGPAPASEDTSNYASVMSGGGGAFFHPSHTNIKEVQSQVTYPSFDRSREKVAEQIFKFRNIMQGGFVWLFGFFIAFAITFTTIFPQSTKDAVDSFPPWVGLGISTGLSKELISPAPPDVKQVPRSTDWGRAPLGFRLGIIWLLAALAMLGGALYYSSRLFKKEYDPTWSKPKKELTRGQRSTLLALVFISFAGLALGISALHTYDEFLTRFASSLIILAALGWAIMAIIESLWYSGWLFEQSYHRNLKWWQYWPLWFLIALPVLSFGASLWFFGKHESALLLSDLGLMLILLLVGGGLTVFAITTGGSLAKGIGKVGFGLLGFPHGLLQLAVPFLLIRKGHLLWAPLATLGLVIGFKYLGRAAAKSENGWPMALVWVSFGILLLLVPFLLSRPLGLPNYGWLQPLLSSDFLGASGTRWLQFLLCIYAGLIGAVMSCVLFAGYLAVALGFNGHNNEAGGAARVEGFKQFIRFRLDQNGLTGYVIAIDEPNTEGGQGKLDPAIIDVFHLRE